MEGKDIYRSGIAKYLILTFDREYRDANNVETSKRFGGYDALLLAGESE